VLGPRTCRLHPTAATRERNHRTLTSTPPEEFDRYWDWFYFLHVDPVQRWIHLVGMLLGTWIFWRAGGLLLEGRWLAGAALGAFGCFPFYGFGVISHNVYDKGAAESDPAYWHVTFFTVVYINLTTMLGLYDRTLRAFVARYPWVRARWDLVDVGARDFLLLLIGRGPAARGG